MVLEIPTNAGQMLDDGNTDTFQLGLVADTGLHEQLGRMDRTQRQHDLAGGPDAMELAIAQEFHASYFLFLKRQARDQCPRQNSQVGTVHVGIDISPEDGLTLAVPDTYIADGTSTVAFHHDAVLIVEGRNAGSRKCIEHRCGERMGIGGRLHEEQAAFATTSGIGRSMPILDTPIDLQHRLIVPAVIAGLGGEMIPVVLMARAATQDLAHGHGNGTSVQSWIWLGSEGPVVFAIAKGGPRRCVLDARDIIATAGFKQEDVDIGVLCQSPRHHRS